MPAGENTDDRAWQAAKGTLVNWLLKRAGVDLATARYFMI